MELALLDLDIEWPVNGPVPAVQVSLGAAI